MCSTQENAGNDPATQLVPAGGAGGWQKPAEEEDSAQAPANTFEAAGSALTAGSNWGSAPAKQGGFGGGRLPGGGGGGDVAAAFAARPPPPNRDQQGRIPAGHPVRDGRLNATEFPSLAAASLPVAPRPPVPLIPATSQVRWNEQVAFPVANVLRKLASLHAWGESTQVLHCATWHVPCRLHRIRGYQNA